MLALILLCSVAASFAVTPYSCAPTSTMGCYVDAMPYRVFAIEYDFMSSTLTQEYCAAVCSNNNYPLAAVEYGTQCFCGTVEQLSNATQATMADCQAMTCPGNRSEFCGAANRMLVYKYSCQGTRVPNNQACVEPFTKSFGFCDQSKTVDQRLDDLSSRLNVSQKIAMISPQPALGITCATHTAAVPELGVPQWVWLEEANTRLTTACVAPEVLRLASVNGLLADNADVGVCHHLQWPFGLWGQLQQDIAPAQRQCHCH